jgi:methionyl aminopeptidase
MCLSVNNTIAHGIPNEYVLQEGDILNVDTGVKLNGVCGDCAMTVPIGKIDNKHERLLRFANRACYVGIQQIKAGVSVIEIARAVETYARQMGYVTNRVFSGHDISEEMHEKVVIPFFYDLHPKYLQHFGGMKLEAGQVVCIEPMLTFKDNQGKLLQDGWGLVTKDGKYSAMFEHMALVKDDGFEILTDHFIKA